MSLSKELNQNITCELLKQLNEDEFFNLLASTTLFRKIPPAQISLATLENLSKTIKPVWLPKNAVLHLDKFDALYEIISGYVKIYDRVLMPVEREAKGFKNLPALLAWRIPGELLNDFQFALPEEKLTDQIVATDNCQLLQIPIKTVHNLAQQYPQIYLNIAGNLAAKAIKTRIRAQILRQPNIKCMIAKMFIELLAERNYDEEINSEDEKLKVLNGTFHVDDIAAFLGYEYHRTQTGVRSMIKAQLIDHYQNKKSGRFMIPDEKRLLKYLEQEQLKVAARKSRRRKKAS